MALKKSSKIKSQRILITGGAGFIGSNLVEYLLEKTEWQINILDNLSTGSYENLKMINDFSESRIQFFKGDIKNERDILKAIRNCDFVVNLAAKTGVIPSQKDPIETTEVNVLGLLNLLEASSVTGVKKFIHISSGAALGKQEVPLDEKKIPCPLSVYGASKLAGEGYCSAYSASFGLESVVLRFASVYGPYSLHKESIVHKIIKQILNKKTINIYGDGNQTRDFLYVGDVCQSIFLALTKKIPNNFELFQIGTNKETSINNLFSLIKKEFIKRGYKVKPSAYKPERPGEIKKNYVNITKARKILGYQLEVGLKEGIAKTIEFYLLNS